MQYRTSLGLGIPIVIMAPKSVSLLWTHVQIMNTAEERNSVGTHIATIHLLQTRISLHLTCHAHPPHSHPAPASAAAAVVVAAVVVVAAAAASAI